MSKQSGWAADWRTVRKPIHKQQEAHRKVLDVLLSCLLPPCRPTGASLMRVGKACSHIRCGQLQWTTSSCIQLGQWHVLRCAHRHLHFPRCQVGDVAIVHTHGPKPEMSLCVIEYLQHNVKKKLGWEPKHVIHRKNEIVEHCGIQVCSGCVITRKRALLCATAY